MIAAYLVSGICCAWLGWLLYASFAYERSRQQLADAWKAHRIAFDFDCRHDSAASQMLLSQAQARLRKAEYQAKRWE